MKLAKMKAMAAGIPCPEKSILIVLKPIQVPRRAKGEISSQLDENAPSWPDYSPFWNISF